MLELGKNIENESVKTVIENRASDKQEVAIMVKRSNRVLVTISTHKFPFDFFPDSISVEEGRMTVISRKFFLASEIHSVDIKDISNIFINMAPFFAQLVIVSKTFTKNEIRIKYLWKNEAIYVRRMLEGLREFVVKEIDTSVYTLVDLREKLCQLSTTDIIV